ncbi:MAG: hypothetical protein ACYTFG_05990 [Planctomycetota bacterium]|jgi:hypothetical protein
MGFRHIDTKTGAALLVIALMMAGCSDFFDGRDNDHKLDGAPPPPAPTDVPVALDITWAVKDDASPVQMSAFANRIEQASAALWAATDGQAYLRNVTLVDNTSVGEVILDNLDQEAAEGMFAYTYQLGGGGYEIHLGGNFPMQAFLHEMGHGFVLQDWALPEEYDMSGSPCPVCAMDAYQLGTGEGKVVFCDTSNCSTTRNGCWENVILGLHQAWTHPHGTGGMPSTNVTIQNN